MQKSEGIEEEKPEDLEMEITDNPDEWEEAARKAAARPGDAERITDVIDRLVAAGRPIDDYPERAGPSGTYHPPRLRCQLDATRVMTTRTTLQRHASASARGTPSF